MDRVGRDRPDLGGGNGAALASASLRLDAVLRAGLLTIAHSGGIERAADHL